MGTAQGKPKEEWRGKTLTMMEDEWGRLSVSHDPGQGNLASPTSMRCT